MPNPGTEKLMRSIGKQVTLPASYARTTASRERGGGLL